VADLPIEALSARAGELAKRWAIALVLARPLQEIGDVPLEDLAREGPSLCVQTLRALESDVELERLTGRGAAGGRERSASPARRLATIAGAGEAAGAVVAAEALRGALWEALLAELHEAAVRHLADACDRLAYVCSAALEVAVTGPSAPIGPGERLQGAAPGAERVYASGASLAATTVRGARVAAGETAAAAQIVDELQVAPAAHPAQGPGVAANPRASEEASVQHTGGAGAIAVEHRPEPEPHRPAEGRSGGEHSRRIVDRWAGVERAALAEDTPAIDRAQASFAPEIAIRDERGSEGPAAWIGSIGRQLSRFAHDGVPFAVLLVQVLGLERVVEEDGPGEVERLLGEVEAMLTGQAASGGLRAGQRPAAGRGAEALASVTRERAGRYWLLARHSDRSGAQQLAERVARAVQDLRSAHGRALGVAIGTACCPQDGLEAAALAAHADVGVYAARSAQRMASRAAAAGQRPR